MAKQKISSIKRKFAKMKKSYHGSNPNALHGVPKSKRKYVYSSAYYYKHPRDVNFYRTTGNQVEFTRAKRGRVS